MIKKLLFLFISVLTVLIAILGNDVERREEFFEFLKDNKLLPFFLQKKLHQMKNPNIELLEINIMRNGGRFTDKDPLFATLIKKTNLQTDMDYLISQSIHNLFSDPEEKSLLISKFNYFELRGKKKYFQKPNN